MKIELAWVDALLNRWGRWALRCQSGALGYATCSILTCAADGDVFDTAIPRGVVDTDMEAIDCAVRKLPKMLRLVIVEVYEFGQGKSERKLAADLGMSRQALTESINRAHRKIALDISVMGCQNTRQSVIGGIAPERNIQPAAA